MVLKPTGGFWKCFTPVLPPQVRYGSVFRLGACWFSFECVGLPPTLPVSLDPRRRSTSSSAPLGRLIKMALFGPKGELLTESEILMKLYNGITTATLRRNALHRSWSTDAIFGKGLGRPPEPANFCSIMRE